MDSREPLFIPLWDGYEINNEGFEDEKPEESKRPKSWADLFNSADYFDNFLKSLSDHELIPVTKISVNVENLTKRFFTRRLINDRQRVYTFRTEVEAEEYCEIFRIFGTQIGNECETLKYIEVPVKSLASGWFGMDDFMETHWEFLCLYLKSFVPFKKLRELWFESIVKRELNIKLECMLDELIDRYPTIETLYFDCIFLHGDPTEYWEIFKNYFNDKQRQIVIFYRKAKVLSDAHVHFFETSDDYCDYIDFVAM